MLLLSAERPRRCVEINALTAAQTSNQSRMRKRKKENENKIRKKEMIKKRERSPK